MTERYNFILPKKLKEELEKEAKERAMTLATYIRQILINRKK